MAKTPKKLVLLDGNALIHRAFHALPPLTTKKGELVNAVYGFSSVLLRVIKELDPDYLLASFDLPGKTFRHEEYEQYKAHRVKAPDELYAQIARIKEIVRAFNIPICEAPGFEADDVIGTMVAQSEQNEEAIENIIVTGDMDTLQLVSPKTRVYALRKGMSDVVLYDEKLVRERYGLTPEQFVDFKALRGDASDNIPGVKGIGEKTAVELIKEYGTLDEIYDSLSKLKPSVREKLEKGRDSAVMSKRLASIVRDVPVELDISKAVVKDFDREKVVKIFQELGFNSLVKRIPENGKKISAGEGLAPARRGRPQGSPLRVDSFEGAELDTFVKILAEQKEIAIHLNVRLLENKKYFKADLQGIAISYSSVKGELAEGYVSYAEENLKKLKPVLENKHVGKIGYNLKHEVQALEKYNIKLQGLSFDVMLAAYLLNAGGGISGGRLKFENIVLSEIGEEVEAENSKGQLALGIESDGDAARKACIRANYILRLEQIYKKRIEETSKDQDKHHGKVDKNTGNLESVFRNLEMPFIPVLAKMEMLGVTLNPEVFIRISDKIEKEIKDLEEAIYTLTGETFNINSSRQLAAILFEKLKISTDEIKKIKTGYSTAAEELSKIRSEHKVIEKIERYRELFKLKTTYIDTLPVMADENSRIHTEFNQAVTATGRLSSSDPNLQNIPIRTDLGQLLRTAFVAEKGYKLVSADYSQIDLRVMAHMSGDEALIETFLKGEDVHRATAAVINKVLLEEVTHDMRYRAKELNFGIIYGMGAYGFSQSAGISREEAEKFIKEYMNKFSGVAKYLEEVKQFARKNGYVETQMGRIRYIPEINSSNFQLVSAAERMAINMPIQGLSADIMKLAMIHVYEAFKNNPDARMLLQVHDEIILEVKSDRADEVAKQVKEIMEKAYALKVPLVVNVETGENWGEV